MLLSSHVPNLESFLQELYIRSTGLSVEPTSAQFSVLSARVAANSAILNQAISVLSQQVSVISQKVSAVGAWAVRGLSGFTSGLSTVNLAADAVQFWNPTDKGINTVVSVAAVTNNVGLSADQVNGRDQAAAFTSAVWIHFYLVLDGTTVKSRSSLTAPPNGPALQGTEKAWAYCGAARRDATNDLIPMIYRGFYAYYDLGDNGVSRVVSGGTATTFTAVALAGFIPPNASYVQLEGILDLSNAAVATFALTLRPTGSAAVGFIPVTVTEQVINTTVDARNTFIMPAGTSQQVDYKIGSAPSTGGVFLEVVGFGMPNGD